MRRARVVCRLEVPKAHVHVMAHVIRKVFKDKRNLISLRLMRKTLPEWLYISKLRLFFVHQLSILNDRTFRKVFSHTPGTHIPNHQDPCHQISTKQSSTNILATPSTRAAFLHPSLSSQLDGTVARSNHVALGPRDKTFHFPRKRRVSPPSSHIHRVIKKQKRPQEAGRVCDTWAQKPHHAAFTFGSCVVHPPCRWPTYNHLEHNKSTNLMNVTLMKVLVIPTHVCRLVRPVNY